MMEVIHPLHNVRKTKVFPWVHEIYKRCRNCCCPKENKGVADSHKAIKKNIKNRLLEEKMKEDPKAVHIVAD
jgi:hypothetical protein